jgi:hypothetical protein
LSTCPLNIYKNFLNITLWIFIEVESIIEVLEHIPFYFLQFRQTIWKWGKVKVAILKISVKSSLKLAPWPWMYPFRASLSHSPYRDQCNHQSTWFSYSNCDADFFCFVFICLDSLWEIKNLKMIPKSSKCENWHKIKW